MTGFGEGAAGRVRCALRSVNSRFLELRLRLPESLRPFEAELEAALKPFLRRGKVDAVFTLEAAADADAAAIASLKLKLAPWLASGFITAPLSLSDLLRLADRVGESAADPALKMEALSAGSRALHAFHADRTREGKALAAAIGQIFDEFRAVLDAAAARAANAPRSLQILLEERLRALVAPVDSARLAQEVALLADRADVTEEVTRLRVHLPAARALLQSPECGKKLDFFVQEMGREVNTFGAKSRDAELAHAVIAMKALLEKVKEQAANLG